MAMWAPVPHPSSAARAKPASYRPTVAGVRQAGTVKPYLALGAGSAELAARGSVRHVQLGALNVVRAAGRVGAEVSVGLDLDGAGPAGRAAYSQRGQPGRWQLRKGMGRDVLLQ